MDQPTTAMPISPPQFPDLTSFIRDTAYYVSKWPLPRYGMEALLHEHPNADHVIDKANACDDFVDFLDRCDPITQGFFYPQLANQSGVLSPYYPTFLHFMDNRQVSMETFSSYTIDQQWGFIHAWRRTLPSNTTRNPFGDVWETLAPRKSPVPTRTYDMVGR